MIRIILADDHQMFLDGVKAFLRKEPTIEVVGEGLSKEQVIACLEREAADILVLDIRMPTEKDGESLCEYVKKHFPDLKVLVLTQEDSPERIKKFMYLKANGYLLKGRSKEELIGALHAIQHAGNYYPPSILNKIIDAPAYRPESEIHFSRREKEVLELIAQGLRDKEIADQLSIAEKTVHKHGQNMRKKVGVNNRMELANYARDHGLL